MLFGHFYSHLSFLYIVSLSLGYGPILTEILSQWAVKTNPTNQPTLCSLWMILQILKFILEVPVISRKIISKRNIKKTLQTLVLVFMSLFSSSYDVLTEDIERRRNGKYYVSFFAFFSITCKVVGAQQMTSQQS